jgi:putative cell wall-binding protein
MVVALVLGGAGAAHADDTWGDGPQPTPDGTAESRDLAPLSDAAPVDSPASVLVFGSSDNGYERDNLAATLTGLGAAVDVEGQLPDDLAPYAEIWNADAYGDFDEVVEQRLVDFVQRGGGLYLTGERPCCEPLNDSVERIVNELVESGGITIGDQGDVDGPFTFNPDAAGGTTRVPNVLVDFVPDSPGGIVGIGGISDANVLASNASIAVGGVWAEDDIAGGVGRLAVLMDIDWLGYDTREPIIENLHSFLSFGVSCAPADEHPTILWTSTLPENCGTIVAPTSVNFLASVQRGSIDVQVEGRGVELDCDHFSGSPQTTASQLCRFTSVPVEGASVVVTATTSDFGESTLFFRIKNKNDPRNVPAGFDGASNWWEWPDTDNDGIPDQWEVNGVWGKNGFLDLPGLGADPQHADLFVYGDYQEGFEVSDEVRANARVAFAGSPLNGGQGVNLHFVGGNAVPGSLIRNLIFTKDVSNQSSVDEETQKDFQRIATYSGFLASPYAGGDGVPQIVKWWLNYDRTDGDVENDGAVLGQAIINGSLLWTSVESQYRQLDPGANERALDWTRAANFVHELGHSIGLGHGGASLEHSKTPKKYKSVMSYSYSTTGVPIVPAPNDPNGKISFRIDYSRQNTINNDWRWRAAGGARYGSLEFVQGQNGEYPGFYGESFANVFSFDGEPTEVHDLEEITREIDPSDYAAFAEEFEFESALEFPAVTPPSGDWSAREQPTLTLQATHVDASAAVLVDEAPAHGTLTTDGLTMTYTPADGYTGADSVTVRVSSGGLSSEPLTVAIAVSAPPYGWPPAVTRVAGADRYEAAVNVSKAAFPKRSADQVVYVVTGTNYPDALSAGPAAAKAGAPLLLTDTATLLPAVKSEIQRLAPAKIVVVGGPNSISAGVFAQLKALQSNTVRISGADRYEASRNLAVYAFGDAPVGTAYLATGGTFPDALSAGAAAASVGGPVVLVNGGASKPDAATTALLDSLQVATVKIAGGPASVSAGIEAGLKKGSRTVMRFGGADRFAVSAAVNGDAFGSSARAFLVTGLKFPDALSGSAWAGKLKAPLYVAHSDCVPAETLAALRAQRVTTVTLIGGTASLDARVEALASCG